MSFWTVSTLALACCSRPSPRGRRPRCDDELCCPCLGRERDLSGAGCRGLFAAFPLAYALILPALYAPIMAMLLALIFRGVAFEFRWRTKRWRRVWDLAFIGGSAMAGLWLGITIDKAAHSYVGGWWDWLTPLPLMVGVAVMVGCSCSSARRCWSRSSWPIRPVPMQDRPERGVFLRPAFLRKLV